MSTTDTQTKPTVKSWKDFIESRNDLSKLVATVDPIIGPFIAALFAAQKTGDSVSDLVTMLKNTAADLQAKFDACMTGEGCGDAAPIECPIGFNTAYWDSWAGKSARQHAQQLRGDFAEKGKRFARTTCKASGVAWK